MALDPTPLLAATPAAAASLYGFHDCNARDLAGGHLRNAFWQDERRAEAAVVAWFRRPEVKAALSHAYALFDAKSEPPLTVSPKWKVPE